MVSVYSFKSKFQALLRPISDGCANLGISANTVTVAALILSVAVGCAVGILTPHNRLWYLILPFALFLRMALNAIDGMIAREHNQKTALGAILNELGDMLADCLIYIPFWYALGADWPLITVFSVLALMSEAVGIMGIQIGASRRYDGPMGKSDRAFWTGAAALIAAFYTIPHQAVCVMLAVVCLLLIYTIINRIFGALREVKK